MQKVPKRDFYVQYLVFDSSISTIYCIEKNLFAHTQRVGVRGCYFTLCYATEWTAGYDKNIFYETDEDEPELRQADDTRSLFSNIVTKHVTAIINVPVMKDHAITGVTLCLKI